MIVQERIRFEKLEPGQSDSVLLADAKRLYLRLFDGFELGPGEIEEILSNPAMMSILIVQTGESGEELIGFYCGTPLGNFELLPRGLRRVIRVLMPRVYFLMALGLDTRGGSNLASTAIWCTYRDLLRRAYSAGYRSLYTLARCGAAVGGERAVVENSRGARAVAMDRHLYEVGARAIWRPIELTPGHLFRPMRIGRLERKLHYLDRKLVRRSGISSR